MANLPADDHAIARLDPAFDEASAEPHRFGLARAVAKVGRRLLDPAAPRLLDADVDDLGDGRRRLSVGKPPQLREGQDLAVVLVAIREVEEQVARGADAALFEETDLARCAEAKPDEREVERVAGRLGGSTSGGGRTGRGRRSPLLG
jgi:hypothetical protein